MALEPRSSVLDDILFVVVTCTRDPSRDGALRKLVRSMEKQHERVGFNGNLLVFDNASQTLAPLKPLEGIARFVLSEANVGYWSALNWCLENAESACGKAFPYVHPIESDFFLYDLDRLSVARDFLESHPEVQTVRTQEFSVRHRQRYFKNGRSLFSVRRSKVADYNGVTEEKVAFDPVDGIPEVFFSNWHAKVPALHRFDALQSVLAQLASQGELSELDFMRLMHQRASRVGVLEGGVFYALLNNPAWFWEKRWVTGSWGNAKELSKVGYRTSRHDTIDATEIEVVVQDGVH